MANIRLNIFENIPVFHKVKNDILIITQSNLKIHAVDIPGSISFNTIAFLLSASGTTAKTLTLSFGLYSLNGSTLSLANSASRSTAPTANQFSWVTLETSATQDITPGSWYFGIITSSSGNSRFSLLMASNPEAGITGPYGGPFLRGINKTTTSALPASIATSDLVKEGGAEGSIGYSRVPYILISA